MSSHFSIVSNPPRSGPSKSSRHNSSPSTPTTATTHTHPCLKGNRLMTSGEALYFLLRANFDGLSSAYIPCPGEVISLPGDSGHTARKRARHSIGHRVAGIMENVTQSTLNANHGHLIVYNIPGPSGSIEPGSRYLNFAWYTNMPRSALSGIITDKFGTLHHTSVPPTLLSPAVWSSQRTLNSSVVFNSVATDKKRQPGYPAGELHSDWENQTARARLKL
ncbi:hypothetical protein BJX61DRAFT_545017 [Aspergillus egyptiacus]|nr:hypothetical protein BJX61DRAFT_545017 [Aspergillus egyptiacus]